MMDSCFGTCFHSSFPENLQCHLVNLHFTFFFSGILSLRYPDTNQIWIAVRYGGWNIFPRVITLVFIWLGKVMSCLAHLAEGPIVIVSFFNKVNQFSMRNLNALFNKLSWWILCVSKVRPLLEDHVNAISKHVCGTPIFNKNIWSTMLNLLINYPNTVVWVMAWNFSSLS